MKKNKILYTVKYCQDNNIAVICQTQHQWDRCRTMYGFCYVKLHGVSDAYLLPNGIWATKEFCKDIICISADVFIRDNEKDFQRLRRQAKRLLVKPTVNITEMDIVDIVADYFLLDTSDLVGKSRKYEIREPRQIAMFLVKEFFNHKFNSEIARDIFKCTATVSPHANFSHAVAKVTKLEKDVPHIASDLKKLRHLIREKMMDNYSKEHGGIISQSTGIIVGHKHILKSDIKTTSDTSNMPDNFTIEKKLHTTSPLKTHKQYPLTQDDMQKEICSSLGVPKELFGKSKDKTNEKHNIHDETAFEWLLDKPKQQKDTVNYHVQAYILPNKKNKK